jgi:diacylglycerol kinase (ATP)
MNVSREAAAGGPVGTEPAAPVPIAAASRRWDPSPEPGGHPAAFVAPGHSVAAGHPWRSKNPLTSFQHAVEGVVHTFRTQRNMRFHFLTVVLVLMSGILYRLPATEMLVLMFTSSLVLITEMFNTAVEAVVDMITLSYHPAAKFAKDVSAGAVLIAAINAVVTGFVLFFGGGRPATLRARLEEPAALYLFLVAAVLLLIAVLLWKVLGEKGTLLQGGVVSGHAAIAFFLATTIMFVANSVFASVLALCLALLVAQSRVEARIHTVREVIIGAALALFLTASVYRIPFWVVRYLPGGAALAPASAAPH